MSRPATVPQEEILARLQRRFRASGYDGASLARLAEETGLAKAGLYHHFPGGKQDMAAAVLSAAGAWMEEHLFRPLRQPGAPAQRLAAMTAALDGYYAGGKEPCLLELFSSGEARQVFGEQVRRGLTRWIGSMASVLENAGADREAALALAEDALVRIQGALVISRGLQTQAPFSRLLQRLPEELLAACTRSSRSGSRPGVRRRDSTQRRKR